MPFIDLIPFILEWDALSSLRKVFWDTLKGITVKFRWAGKVRKWILLTKGLIQHISKAFLGLALPPSKRAICLEDISPGFPLAAGKTWGPQISTTCNKKEAAYGSYGWGHHDLEGSSLHQVTLGGVQNENIRTSISVSLFSNKKLSFANIYHTGWPWDPVVYGILREEGKEPYLGWGGGRLGNGFY